MITKGMLLFVLIDGTGMGNFCLLANSAVGVSLRWLIYFTAQQVRVFMGGTVILVLWGV
jgi:hypothetical protein